MGVTKWLGPQVLPVVSGNLATSALGRDLSLAADWAASAVRHPADARWPTQERQLWASNIG